MIPAHVHVTSLCIPVCPSKQAGQPLDSQSQPFFTKSREHKCLFSLLPSRTRLTEGSAEQSMQSPAGGCCCCCCAVLAAFASSQHFHTCSLSSHGSTWQYAIWHHAEKTQRQTANHATRSLRLDAVGCRSTAVATYVTCGECEHCYARWLPA